VREKYCWLAENKRLRAQANRLFYEIDIIRRKKKQREKIDIIMAIYKCILIWAILLSLILSIIASSYKLAVQSSLQVNFLFLS
jgi:hypothetical protein